MYITWAYGPHLEQQGRLPDQRGIGMVQHFDMFSKVAWEDDIPKAHKISVG